MAKHTSSACPTHVLAPALCAIVALLASALVVPQALDAIQAGALAGGSTVAPSEPLVSMIVPGGEAMKYWSRWRGPSGQGLVEGAAYPDTWSGTQNVVWKTPVLGRGHSSPIVWGDRIFLTTAAADGSSRSVLCFRRSDGKQLWQTEVPAAKPEDLYRRTATHRPRSRPTASASTRISAMPACWPSTSTASWSGT